jgi:hypothetical protein
MASIHLYETKKGERRYTVRYRDQQRRERSKAFPARKDAQAFKLEVERKRPTARDQHPTHKVKGSHLFDEGELRHWLRSRQQDSTLDGNANG